LNILITGASGFVGQNLMNFFENKNHLTAYNRREILHINTEAVIHLAGKAHDLKNVSTPDAYYEANTKFTEKVFDAFLQSDATVFITLSSVKAVSDKVEGEQTENDIPNPTTHYGKSKLQADLYILNQPNTEGKRIYILRPCMIHGPNNKGNLNLLYKMVSKRVPWPLGSFHNRRSYCSIDNLCFIINELLHKTDIPSGVYQVADDEPVSTNDVIKLIAQSQNKSALIINLPKELIRWMAKIGDLLKLPFNTERLEKLTENYQVSNQKLIQALGKPLPIGSREGLKKTFLTFNKNVK
jgi:nucleoside-diphosphate-sugar epimerase